MGDEGWLDSDDAAAIMDARVSKWFERPRIWVSIVDTASNDDIAVAQAEVAKYERQVLESGNRMLHKRLSPTSNKR